MTDPIIVRTEPTAGRAAMPFAEFLATFGQPGDAERSGLIRAALQQRGLLIAGNVDPHAAWPVLQQTRTATTATARATTAPPRRRTRSLEALLALDLEPDDPQLTPAEQRLLDDHHSREYWSARMNRR